MRGAVVHGWTRLERPQRVAVAGLAVLLAGGVVLRVALMLAYRPGFVGYHDTWVYLDAANGALFWDPLRPAGYPIFLQLVHGLESSLAVTILVQHGLGVATALLLYGAVRRIGGPPWLALVPAAAVLLCGDQVFFEHALLTESLFTFLTAAGVYAAARCLDERRALVWAAVAGLALSVAVTVRLAGLPMLALVALWLLAGPDVGWRRRAASAAACAAVAAGVLGGYLAVAHDRTGEWSFARNGAYNFYGRVATFADCTKFDPPNRTHVLCEATPRSERPSALAYVFEGRVNHHFGRGNLDEPSREDVELVARFSREAALHQPLDWLRAGSRDFVRYVSPDSNRGPSPTPSAEDYVAHFLTIPDMERDNLRRAGAYYSTSSRASVRGGLYETLRDYASASRIEGAPLGVLLVLALAAPLACRGRERRGALLLAAVGLSLLVVPVMTLNYDGRFGVPSYGFVAGAASLGGCGLAQALTRRRLGSGARGPAPAAPPAG